MSDLVTQHDLIYIAILALGIGFWGSHRFSFAVNLTATILTFIGLLALMIIVNLVIAGVSYYVG